MFSPPRFPRVCFVFGEGGGRAGVCCVGERCLGLGVGALRTNEGGRWGGGGRRRSLSPPLLALLRSPQLPFSDPATSAPYDFHPPTNPHPLTRPTHPSPFNAAAGVRARPPTFLTPLLPLASLFTWRRGDCQVGVVHLLSGFHGHCGTLMPVLRGGAYTKSAHRGLLTIFYPRQAGGRGHFSPAT